MLSTLIAYDAAGNIVATLDEMVAKDSQDRVVGLIDFAHYENQGRRLRDLWLVEHVTLDGAGAEMRAAVAGSTSWPEWLGSAAHDFRVELGVGPGGRPRARALVHRSSGHRRERASIEAAIKARIDAAGDEPADIRDLVGGPDRPLQLDAAGRTVVRTQVGDSEQAPR